MIDFVSYNSGSNSASNFKLASLNYKPDYPWIVHELYLKSQVWFRPKGQNTKFNNYCFFSSCYMSFFLTVILARSLNFLSWCNLVSKLKTFVMKLWGSGSAYKEHVDFYTHAICWSIMKCIIDFVWQYTLKLIRQRTAVRYDIIAVAFVSFKIRCQKVTWLWFKWIYWCLWLFFSHKCSIAIVKVLNTLINQSFSLWYRIN